MPALPACSKKDPKFVYYLSAEFLMGRSLLNVVSNLGLKGQYRTPLLPFGLLRYVADCARPCSTAVRAAPFTWRVHPSTALVLTGSQHADPLLPLRNPQPLTRIAASHPPQATTPTR